ncbi:MULTISPECIES: hypothetical protein [Nostocales]|uniref:Uncharacterized protein n=3 Tax=Nostocales TaxID=1161 RepID=A0A8S9T7G0_9CYAN|nr:hypothetical protein [Tolypothrix bouteillei]KAF3887927.1 hypothetical protein DA73_0400022360 [Tolypothrix bouteillei VB521301]
MNEIEDTLFFVLEFPLQSYTILEFRWVDAWIEKALPGLNFAQLPSHSLFQIGMRE